MRHLVSTAALVCAVPLLGLWLAEAPVQAGQSAIEIGLQMKVSPHRPLYATALSGDAGVAVGALGTVLETRDGGASWTDQSLDVPLALLAVTLAGDRAVAVGQMGLVAIREGGVWHMLKAPTDERLFGVALNRDGFALAVGAFGTALRSTNGGADWEPLEIDWEELVPGGYEPHLYDVLVDAAGRVVVVGEFGLVIRSEDGGRHWRRLRQGDESLFALHIDGATLMAVGQEGAVLRSRDDGNTWTMLKTGVTANLLGIAPGPGREVFLAPGMRVVLYSSDGGDSWRQLVHDDFSRGWYGDAAWSAGRGGFLAVGHGGHIKNIKGIK